MSTFVLQINDDPGRDMWWDNWLVIDIEENAVTQDDVAAVTQPLAIFQSTDVHTARNMVFSALRAAGWTARVRPAKAVFTGG